jgi:nucleoside-diphosphate-sugar epimerase
VSAVRRALVTGAGGFLGGEIVRHLEAGGAWEVAAARTRRDIAELDRIAGDERIDAIVHAGFEVDFSPAVSGVSESENVRTTRRLAAWAKARGFPHFVFLSAAGILGVSKGPRVRNEDDRGSTDAPFASYRGTRYVGDKLLCEEALAAYPGTASILYLTTVYGASMPRETRVALTRMRGLNPVVLVPPGGTSFLALEDFLFAFDLVLEKRPSRSLVLSGGNVSYRALYETAAAVLGVSRRKKIVPLPAATVRVARRFAGRFLTTAVLESAFGFKYYSAERARATIGWEPRRMLAETLRAALAPLPGTSPRG